MIQPMETIARTVVVALGASVAYGALLTAIVAIAIRASGASATTRHVLWWLALAASVAIPFASVASSLSRVERHARPSMAAAAAQPAATIADAAVRFPHAGETLVVVWLCVALVSGVSLARSFRALRAIKRASEPIDERVERRLRRFRYSARSGRRVTLRVSEGIDVPAAVGFRSPVILVPARLAGSDRTPGADGDLDQIVLHEYAHLERYDDWTNAFQLVLARAFWFNPFVAFFAARIALEREIACDDWVVARTGRAHRYATCLWRFLESVQLPARRSVAPGFLFSARAIAVRMEQLLDARRNALPRVSPIVAGALAAVALALVGVQAERAPAVVFDVATAERVSAPRVADTPAPAPSASPRPRVERDERRIALHDVPVEATPDAIARAVARAVSERRHADVTTAVSRRTTGPHSYADEIRIDIGRDARLERAPVTARASASAAKHPEPSRATYGRRAQS